MPLAWPQLFPSRLARKSPSSMNPYLQVYEHADYDRCPSVRPIVHPFFAPNIYMNIPTSDLARPFLTSTPDVLYMYVIQEPCDLSFFFSSANSMLRRRICCWSPNTSGTSCFLLTLPMAFFGIASTIFKSAFCVSTYCQSRRTKITAYLAESCTRQAGPSALAACP